MTRRTWSSVTVSSPSSAASALAACVLNDRMHKMEVFPPPELMKMRLVHYQGASDGDTNHINPTHCSAPPPHTVTLPQGWLPGLLSRV